VFGKDDSELLLVNLVEKGDPLILRLREIRLLEPEEGFFPSVVFFGSRIVMGALVLL
jgi:hypothetical protein